MATAAPSIPADDLFPVAEPCPRCDQLACECERPAGLLGALADVPQPAELPPPEALPDFALAARLIASPALGAFLGLRLEQAVKFGHTPEKDRELPPHWIVQEAEKRLRAVLEDVGRDNGGPPRSARHQQRREHALKRVTVAGALLLAAHDQLSHLVAQGRDVAFAPDARED